MKLIIKAITWRVVATTISFSIAYILTGQLIQSIKFGIINMTLSTIAYILHEKIWDWIQRKLYKKYKWKNDSVDYEENLTQILTDQEVKRMNKRINGSKKSKVKPLTQKQINKMLDGLGE